MIENRMKGDVEFEYLFLKDANLKPCIGCYNCMAKGEDKCPLKDDRAAIELKLLAADGFILSSPVYVGNVSWLMKNFIDRFAYMNHRPRFHHQKMLTVVNMAGTDRKGALPVLNIALGYARGVRIVHKLAIATPPWPQTERTVAQKEQVIDAAAKKFYRIRFMACGEKGGIIKLKPVYGVRIYPFEIAFLILFLFLFEYRDLVL